MGLIYSLQRSMEYEPSARWFHGAISMGHNMLVLAGEFKGDFRFPVGVDLSGYGSGRSFVDSSIVESFNVSSMSWQSQRHLLNQTLPECYSRMAAASDGENVYMFAGRIKLDQLCNKIYIVNLMTLECSELIPATPVCPTPRDDSKLIYWNRTLVSYGGDVTAYGAASNELFVFDLNTSEAVTITMQTQ